MLFTFDWTILLRTTVVYLALLVGLRAFGKREIGQMSPFDLVLLLLTLMQCKMLWSARTVR